MQNSAENKEFCSICHLNHILETPKLIMSGERKVRVCSGLFMRYDISSERAQQITKNIGLKYEEQDVMIYVFQREAYQAIKEEKLEEMKKKLAPIEEKRKQSEFLRKELARSGAKEESDNERQEKLFELRAQDHTDRLLEAIIKGRCQKKIETLHSILKDDAIRANEFNNVNVHIC